ncbi:MULTISPECIES: ABC transporter permease [Staphylococcus]|jgi:osmoprotectant transport system permease protein|uniref:ABC transporter permease n=1 Tax=Staphylococcus nepalensis TaxID=214473 RepID=A0A291JHG2_9STAP|nr:MULTISPECIES: ABC transporter permease [Staphylococcus]VDG66234.1 glycine/betaine transport system permease protein [Lacrimispora indolis]ATH59314.1 amino acid ABC transporter permease [Staphylococcus nepalensis]ATH64407.1 amino acid ABC transporter permease [Staphylococcus nepalensis]AWI43767.1 amino acid ABC transporter permease [Staphylococcus nepalensis]MBO1205621.1 ABC transporter permease [Staphylococcus nepalensis]
MEGNLLQQLVEYYSVNYGYLWDLFLKHLLMSVYGVLFASIVGIPIGIVIARYSKFSGLIITIANIIQTVPVIAMLAILMLVMGLGTTTVVVTVFLYALLPIIKNTYTGIMGVDVNIKDAGKGMGMTRNQVLRMIELPLSLSVILGGLRIALVVAIGVVAVGSFIGAPTLGDIVIRGTNATDGTTFILAGAIPIALIAILIDVGLRLLEKRLDPAHRAEKRSKQQPQTINE